MSQSVIQDMWWLDVAQRLICGVQLPVYFIPQSDGDLMTYYVVVLVPDEFTVVHEDTWRRFMASGDLMVMLFMEMGQEWPPQNSDGDALPVPMWNCDIMDAPETFSVLKENGHLTRELDGHNQLVLRVRRPAHTETNRMPGFPLIEFSTLDEAQGLDVKD